MDNIWDAQCDHILTTVKHDYSLLHQKLDQVSCLGEVHVVGSWSYGTVYSPNTKIDVIIEMPASIFREKDYLDGRYIARITEFLENLAKNVSGARIVHGIMEYKDFRVIPVIPEDQFSLKRLAPSHRNDRRVPGDGPTPEYNNDLIGLLTLAKRNKEMSKILNEDKNLRNAALLLRIWLNKRGLSSQLPGYFAPALIVHLATDDSHMSPFIILRKALDHLKTCSMLHGSGALFDFSGFNVLGRVHAMAVQDLGEEAQLTLDAFQNSTGLDRFQVFENTFNNTLDPMVKYDDLVLISEDNDTYLLAELLAKGLGTRVRRVGVVKHGVIGVMYDADEHTRGIDMGPQSSDVAASKAFRELWGDEAELRRFKDGTMCECVVWDVPVQHRYRILELAAKHLFKRHHGIEKVTTMSMKVMGDDQVEQDHIKIYALFEKLTLWLRALRSIPLPIRNVTGIHPALRTQGSVKHRGAMRGAIDALVISVGLESSGKWPNEQDALSSMKTAFLIQMSEELSEQHGVVTIPARNSLDVVFGDIVFRVVIATEQELGLSDGETVRRDVVHLPRHSASVHALMLNNPGILFREWLSAHMIIMSDEVIDLLTCHVYVSAYPYRVPVSGVCGFRRVLALLSTYRWNERALVVDIDGTVTDSVKRSVDGKFSGELMIATGMDTDGTWWTLPSPSMWKRVIRYAQSGDSVDMLDFDVIIHLSPSFGKIAGYNPVLIFLSQFVSIYGHLADVYCDVYGVRSSDEVPIGLVWRRRAFLPSVSGSVPGTMVLINVSVLTSTQPMHGTSMSMPNVMEVLRGIREIGGALVGGVDIL